MAATLISWCLLNSQQLIRCLWRGRLRLSSRIWAPKLAWSNKWFTYRSQRSIWTYKVTWKKCFPILISQELRRKCRNNSKIYLILSSLEINRLRLRWKMLLNSKVSTSYQKSQARPAAWIYRMYSKNLPKLMSNLIINKMIHKQ